MNLEIEFVSRDYIALDDLTAFLSENALSTTIKELHFIDSWKWENYEAQININAILPELDKGRIAILSLNIAGVEAGMYIERENGLYIYSPWADAELVYAKLSMEELLEKFCTLVDKSLDSLSYRLAVCAVGEEMLFEFSEDFAQTEEKSSGVEMYILPLEKMIASERYTVKVYSNVVSLQTRDQGAII